jgi:serine/threonine-protein kinase
MAESPLTLADRYRLDHIIGRGGMAEVWQGRDLRLGRDVAIKRLRADLATDPTFQARFQREAQSAAGLNHPNIVAVYDTGTQVDPVSGVSVPYIVMELVHGRTLRDMLREDVPISVNQALIYTQGVLDALSYSHQRGIVHRDIKPANVMLTPAGVVKVMDFGIARAVADTSATMTQTAAVIGTAQYLSPEQARGETVDARSDVYSTGCLLYELLTRRPPFVGDSPVSVAYQHVREMPIPPSQLNPAVTPAVDAIVMQALAKSPAARYQSAAEMKDDIDRALSGQQVQATVPAMPEGTALIESEAATKVLATPPAPPAPPAPEPGEVTNGTGLLHMVEDEDEGPEAPHHKLSPATIVLIVLGALVVVGIVIVAIKLGVGGGVSEPPTTVVPNVVTMSETDAKTAIQGKNLNAKSANVTIGDATQPDCTTDNKGKVVDQDPDANTQVATGTDVTITVCQGPGQITIPEAILTMTQAEATAKLKGLGFTGQLNPGTPPKGMEPAKSVAGTVVGTNPPVGSTVSATGVITLFLAQGTITIPKDLVGKLPSDAQSELTALGWAGTFTDQQADPSVEPPNMKAGTIVDTDPGAGMTVGPTDPITLILANGTITIPNDMVGQQQAAAQTELTALGWTGTFTVTQADPTTEPTTAQAGQILSTDQQAGAVVPANQTIAITVATGQSIVPDVVGEQQVDAMQDLQNAGFKVADGTQYPASEEPKGQVISQLPQGHTPWDRSQPVQLVVSGGPSGEQSPAPSTTP